MTKAKGAIVLNHMQHEGALTMGYVLTKRGFRIRSISVPAQGIKDIDPLRPDLVIVMGGPIGVNQAEDYPFLKDEIALINARAKADLPTIGICLGGQLMAAALGEDIYQGTQGMEIGWNPLVINDAGKDTPARHLDAAQTNMFHWHYDTFNLPQGATLLASSNKYENQIYSYGKNLLGMQCHPEVRKERLEEWFVANQIKLTGENPLLDIHQLRKDTAINAPIMNKQVEIFFNEWLDQVGL